MKQSPSNFLFLPDCLPEDLASQHFGKLKPVVTRLSEGIPYRIFDSFDQALLASDRLLLQKSNQLELFQGADLPLVQKTTEKPGFVADLPNGDLKKALCDVAPLRSLLEIGKVAASRTLLSLADDEEKTRAKARLISLQTKEGMQGLVISLQALRGYDKALLLLRKTFLDLGAKAFCVSDIYQHLFPARPVYDPKPSISIGYDEAAKDVATHIMAAYLPVARANEAGVIADIDTEFLHDYRIALRKIRSVISLFKGVYGAKETRELKARFSSLMAATGRQRDLDVYLLDEQRYYRMLPEVMHPGLKRMFAIFAEERAAEFASLSAHLQSKAYEKEISALAKVLRKPKKLGHGPNSDLPAHDYASKLIWKRYRKICKIASGIKADTDDAEVHELRIHCKKLRYLMEFFAPVFPKKEMKRLIKPLKHLQNNLGYFNDYSVQKDALAVFLETHQDGGKKAQRELAQSVGALIAVLHRRQLEERARVMQSFARFDSEGTRQTFQTLFHDEGNAA